MTSAGLDIGFVMLHTSPLDVPGTKDAGGMNVVVKAQAEALARAGHRVRIFTRRSSEEPAERVGLAPNLEVVHLAAGPARLLAKGDHEGVVAEFAEALAAEIARDPAQLLHAEHWFSGIAALPAAESAGIPLVVSFHSIAADEDSPLGDGERPESPGRRAGERLIAQAADLVIAVSEAERLTILDRLGGDPARVCVVPLGVDTKLFRPCETRECDERRDWFAHGGRPEVLVVGRLHPLKGFDLAIEAVAAIPSERRPVLRIVGSPPPDGDDYVEGLHDAIARHRMITTVAFEGALRRGELAKRFQESTLVLVPSHSETFGLVALEAAATGVPVVARNAGGLREAVVDGETGILVSGDDPAAWAAAIERLLQDPELAERMGAAARQHALAMSWEASAACLEDAYRAVLTQRMAPA
ncbi:glycosyltransferase [Leucobacter luti]|uniref:glycosyltransferase n=1 Tax=Leucobacter luti TaxID=340320 RepID=UPI003CFE4AC6